MAKKENALSHTKWMCKYHIVFTPKYRRKIIYNQLIKEDIRDILNVGLSNICYTKLNKIL